VGSFEMYCFKWVNFLAIRQKILFDTGLLRPII